MGVREENLFVVLLLEALHTYCLSWTRYVSTCKMETIQYDIHRYHVLCTLSPSQFLLSKWFPLFAPDRDMF